MSMCIRWSVLALAALSAACSVQDTPIPQLAGPSELALRVALQAIPDSILQDGFSQAAIQIEATNGDGRPARALTLRIQSEVGGALADFGTLSAKTVVTGDDGRARVTYTSPPRPASQVEGLTVVTFRVEPVGTDYRGEIYRTVDLRLVVPGVIQPPLPQVALPRPGFTVSGNSGILTNVIFDASTTEYDKGAKDGVPQFAVCGQLCTYVWDFGDGTTGAGVFATHQYRQVATFQVRLTVTDPYGQTASSAQPVSVGQGGQPSATFTYSPSAPAVNQQIFFNAEASRASAGRTLVAWDWNFGSGRTASGETVRQAFSATGTYTVTLTVTDDAGNKATTSQSVTINLVGTLQAVLSYSPTSNIRAGQQVQFDGAGSVAGSSPIVEYRFNFGDGSADFVTTIPVTTHQFTAAGSYQVSLVVKDSQGRTSIARATVTVADPAAGTAGLVAQVKASRVTAAVNENVEFDASGSTPAADIVNYEFDFGDGSPQVSGSASKVTHQFTSAAIRTVKVTVKNKAALEASTTTQVTIQ